MFRLEILEDIARDKVRTLHFVDEIEVLPGRSRPCSQRNFSSPLP
ncbi:hypothetical protein Asd1617_06205 (plasmid) [Shigella dysenteriae 1617]|uniref:Uncharacterized protein n=1 Tax=Shigella dysenteriae 1617 TaxID=754093 RepID=A0A0A7A475_SHIDY|nr:hypothetical protein Asd1617_06205 [Shigella dysenteriae 1617]